MVMKKIKLTESDLYRIVRKVLLEQEEENNRRIFNENPEYFKTILKNVFKNDSKKLTRFFNKQYDKVIINGSLNLEGAPIQSLPDNLYVGGELDLSYCEEIETLPETLEVKGNIDLSYSSIKYLPDNFKVPKNLFLDYSKLEHLPDNLTVGNNLIVRSTLITKLPNNLKVGGKLNIRNTEVEELPDDLEVKSLILIDFTPLSYNLDLQKKYKEKGFILYTN